MAGRSSRVKRPAAPPPAIRRRRRRRRRRPRGRCRQLPRRSRTRARRSGRDWRPGGGGGGGRRMRSTAAARSSARRPARRRRRGADGDDFGGVDALPQDVQAGRAAGVRAPAHGRRPGRRAAIAAFSRDGLEVARKPVPMRAATPGAKRAKLHWDAMSARRRRHVGERAGPRTRSAGSRTTRTARVRSARGWASDLRRERHGPPRNALQPRRRVSSVMRARATGRHGGDRRHCAGRVSLRAARGQRARAGPAAISISLMPSSWRRSRAPSKGASRRWPAASRGSPRRRRASVEQLETLRRRHADAGGAAARARRRA